MTRAKVLLLGAACTLAVADFSLIAAEAITSKTPNGVRIECVYDSWSDSYFVIFSKWKDIEVVPYSVCPDMERKWIDDNGN